MKIKLQILTENIEMLPDEHEMSVVTDCFKLHATENFENSVIGNYYHCSTYVVVANKGLHPTKFTNPRLYKTKNFITLSLLNIIFYSHFIPFISPFLVFSGSFIRCDGIYSSSV